MWPPSNALAHTHFLKGGLWGTCFLLIWRTPQLQIIPAVATSHTVEFSCRYFAFSHRKKYTIIMTIRNTVGPALAQYWKKRFSFFYIHLFLSINAFLMAFRNSLASHPTKRWKTFAEQPSLVLLASRFSDADVTSASLQTTTRGLCCFSPCSFLNSRGKKGKKKKPRQNVVLLYNEDNSLWYNKSCTILQQLLHSLPHEKYEVSRWLI